MVTGPPVSVGFMDPKTRLHLVNLRVEEDPMWRPQYGRKPRIIGRPGHLDRRSNLVSPEGLRSLSRSR